MVASNDGILAVVIGDDAVASGMLALDLVQAGFNAHGAGDMWAAAERLRGSDPSAVPPVLVAIYRDLNHTLDVWRHVQREGVRVRLVVAARDEDLATAEAAALADGWLGVLRTPIRTESLILLLDRQALGADAPPRDERGELATLGVADVLERELQSARHDTSRRNSVLRVTSRDLSGDIAIVDGQLVHAEVGSDRGRHALERMVCWRDGTWTLRLEVYTGDHTLSGVWRSVLAVALEYARRVDEARRSMPLQGDVCTVRWERVRPLPVVAEALFRRLASGITLRDALDGRGDDELEAYAALLTRIRRGAVEPLEQTVTDAPTRYATMTHRRPGQRKSGHAAMDGAAPAESAHIRTSESHRRPPPSRPSPSQPSSSRPPHRQASAGLTQAVRAAGTAGQASPPQIGTTAGKRHPETATYRVAPLGQFAAPVPGDLPVASADSVHAHTPLHAPVLPAQLPAAESDGWEAAPAERAPVDPVFAATGWFGLNVGASANAALGAQVDAMRDALVQGSEPGATSHLDARMSQSVAELPRAAPESDSHAAEELDDAYSLFASDDEVDEMYDEDRERSQLEQLAPTGVAGRKARLFWVAALLFVASVLALVIWPGSPLYEGDATRPPAIRSYQRAVDLIDAGKMEQASALLRMVQGRETVPAEATLQLAVLEVKARRFPNARRHLRAYLKLPDAQHIKAASDLYVYVFGAAP